MRILLVLNDAKDFAWHRAPIVAEARARGHEVHLAAPPSAAEGAIHEAKVPLHPVPIDRRGTDPLADARTTRALARLYREVRPDVVHHFTIKPVIYGGVAARLAKVPASVSTVTGLGHAFLARGVRGRVLRVIARSGYRAAFAHPRARIIFQNEDDRDLFLAHGLVDAERTRLIRGSGVDVHAFSPTPEPEGVPVVLLAARLLREKGVVEFAEAARVLRAKGVSARFVLAGAPDPGNPSSLEAAQIEGWVKEGILEWWGERRDMPAVMAASAIVCLPSYREGLPKVLLEAMAAQRAVVTTDTPGCRDLVRGGAGLTVPARDAAALAEAIRALLEDPTRRRAMAQTGRAEAVAHHASERIARAIVDLYEELEGVRA